jgi:arylsulfatase A-like enzyme
MTRPAHFSLFTSRYPREHGVLNNQLSLPESELTLAEVFAEHGYRTGAFVAVSILARDSGAGQGFEHLEPPSGRQRSAEPVVASTLAWLGALDANEPFFAWVHLFDPHMPYQQIDPALGTVDLAMLAALPRVDWPELYRVAGEHDGDIPRGVLDHARALYRSEVAYVDQQVGRLLDGLAALRDRDDVIVVVTSDHGECFEHGVYFEHSDCLLESALRVPLLIRHPPEFEPGARSATVVSHLDLAPTLLEATGIDPPEIFGGTALQRVGEDERQVLVQHPFYQRKAVEGRLEERKAIETVAGLPAARVLIEQEKVGVVSSDWKYLRTGGREELYRLGALADESSNLATREVAQREERAAALAELLERHPLVLLDAAEINDELRATLEALGYLR